MVTNAARNLRHHKMVGHIAKIDAFTILANVPYFVFDAPKQFIANNTVPSHTDSLSFGYVFSKAGIRLKAVVVYKIVSEELKTS